MVFDSPESAVHASAIGADREHLWHPFTRQRDYDPAQMIVSGDGAWVTDVHGRRLLDGFSGLWSVNLGYGRTDIADAVTRQLAQLPSASLFAQGHPSAALLAERLTRLTPGNLNKVFFSLQGAQAVETAMKLARLYFRARGHPQKTIIVSRDRAYHGTAYGGTSLQGIADNRIPFEPNLPDVRRIAAPDPLRCRTCREVCTLGCADELDVLVEREGAERVAAIIVEPVMGSGGVFPPPPGYLQRLRELCDRHDILLIADEVMTGLGRTGRWFAVDHFDVVPDILLAAKGLTGGYMPLAATITSPGIYDAVTGQTGAGPEFATGNTWDGHPPSCAAALATLDALEGEHLVDRVASLAPEFAAQLGRLDGRPGIGQLRSIGFIGGIELVKDAVTGGPHAPQAGAAARFAAHCRDHGLIVRPLAGGSVVALAPPFIVTREELAFLGDVLVEAHAATIEELNCT